MHNVNLLADHVDDVSSSYRQNIMAAVNELLDEVHALDTSCDT